VWPGPRHDWFEGSSSTLLTTDAWTIDNASRVGLRLAGAAVRRVLDDELVSEGLVAGAIQVPPDGQPVVMLADHPTTGGYPVIAVVDPDDLAALAQRRVGSVVRFSHAQ
jgi:allophanate hydrolase subunit 2